MEKNIEEEYRHYIYTRCADVIQSCTNSRQLWMARDYCQAFANVYYRYHDMDSVIEQMYLHKYDWFLDEQDKANKLVSQDD